MKFTSGPWFYKKDLVTIFSEEGDICDLVTSINGKQMPVEANGYLIASAPEMYKELERHCALCMLMHPECEGCDFCDTEKVLMKARGGK